MYTPINLQEVTDRVQGLSPPRVPMSARLPRPWDRQMGFVLLVISALVSAACVALWLYGHATIALCVFIASVVSLSLAVRLL